MHAWLYQLSNFCSSSVPLAATEEAPPSSQCDNIGIVVGAVVVVLVVVVVAVTVVLVTYLVLRHKRVGKM